MDKLSPAAGQPMIGAGDVPCPGAPYARDELLHEIFATAAARHGHSPALHVLAPDSEQARKSVLPYWELRERAARFANYLRSLGVKRGARVLICLPRSLDQYMTILGILEVGAVYIPLDWSYPQERADFIAKDCAADMVVTLKERVPYFPDMPTAIALDSRLAEIAAAPALGLTREQTGARPDDLAYIIYTSGTTGRPKGVMIRHRNVCHLVRAEAAVLGVAPDDKVFGGFSLAFDMSIETMWSAFFAGAELLVASEAMANAGPDLADVLSEARVSVWHAVPSLLATIDQDVPSARLINMGGEVCPPELVRRWSRPERRLLNTYGPTETTVTATWKELAGDRPVTIGMPLPGYDAWIVDGELNPVPPGSEGELLIGGPGVAAGYLNRPDLTAQKFIAWPPGGEGRVYRTGDLVRLDRHGDVAFLGRIDNQVKIRGFRVELGEIEAIIGEDPAVGQAVVQLFLEADGSQILIAFVTSKSGHRIDPARLAASAKDSLPAYMRPVHFEIMASLPLLVSGKTDRSALRKPVLGASSKRPRDPAATPLEAQLVDVWNNVFAPQTVGVLDDFFEDLGGHSLKAARMVSIARQISSLGKISIGDLYAAPTVRALAQRVAQRQARAATPSPEFFHIAEWRRFLCVAGQAMALPFIFTLSGLQWLTPYLTYTWLVSNDMSRLSAVLTAALSIVVVPPVLVLLSIGLKWVVLGRLQAGDYPLWGFYYFRWWLVRRVLAVMPTRFLGGTPLMNIYLRMLGTRVGKGAYLAMADLDGWDLIEIGDGAMLSEECRPSAVSMEHGLFRVRPVSIGAGAFLGVRSAIGSGSCMGAGAVLEDLSALSPGQDIPAGEVWDGSPARCIGLAPSMTARENPSFARRALMIGGLLAGIMLLPLVAIIPIAPGLIAMIEIDWATTGYLYVASAPALALAYVILMCLLTVGCKWLLLGRVRPGTYSIWSGFYLRFWFVRQLGQMALDLLHPLFATLYVLPWYRAFGAKVGRRAEISTATSVVHDLVEVGPESFIADGVVFGGMRLLPGAICLAKAHIGRRSFVGNSALLPPGAAVGDSVLIGVLSKPPKGKAALEAGSTWFGSPPIRLPHRQTSALFNEGATFKPAKRLVAARLAIEYIRVTLSLTVFIALFDLMLSVMGDLADLPHGLASMVVAFPLLYMGFCLGAGLFVLLLKWTVIGRYKANVQPLWSFFVWRTELVTSTYENLAVPLLLTPLLGTPFLNFYLRLMGCKIGSRTFIDTTDITEFDLVHVGQDVALNADAGLQTHLFEDRVMKVSGITIGDRAVIGSMAIVLYDSVIEADAKLGDLSVVMKGERLPAGTSWEGSPAGPADHAA